MSKVTQQWNTVVLSIWYFGRRITTKIFGLAVGCQDSALVVNENTNERLRRHLPRETEIAKIAQSQLNELATKMNQCPRKCIGFKTPNEQFIQQYKNDCCIWS